MSRKIKFRAYDTLNQRWYDWEDGDLDYIDSFAYMNLADNIKIMQFTGLYDKSGKEIYEGDILGNISKATSPYIVKWDNDRSGWMVHFRVHGQPIAKRMTWSVAKYKKHEVIGNIYENKDLL